MEFKELFDALMRKQSSLLVPSTSTVEYVIQGKKYRMHTEKSKVIQKSTHGNNRVVTENKLSATDYKKINKAVEDGILCYSCSPIHCGDGKGSTKCQGLYEKGCRWLKS